LPEKSEYYVHRVGRTGRGVNKGVAISFCSQGEKECLDQIQKFLNKEIEVIEIGKKDYAVVLDSPKEEMSLQELIDEHENWLKKKKSKKTRKRK
jgi:ATP-dependent RNA helicase RhlE